MVPAKGVERWLTQRLSPPARHRAARRRRGVRGGAVPQPALAGLACCSAASATTRGTPTGWSGRCSRPSTTASASPWCATLAAHLGHGLDGPDGELRRNRRYSVAHPAGPPLRVVRRAAAVAGHRLARGPDTDGAGDLADDLRWQAELWRRLLAAGRTRRRPTSGTPRPSRRLRAGRRRAAAARRGCRCSATPGSRSPRSSCWRRSASTATCTSACRSPRPRSGTTWPGSAASVAARRGHLRRPGRPPAARLARPRRPRAAAHPRRRSRATTSRRRRATRPDTLLGWLQHDLRANHAPTYDERAGRAASPTTTAACRCTPATAPARQVDVLREVLVGLLEDDPTLEPRDILVMCPDIETFAPLISAGFGLGRPSTARPPRPPSCGCKLADRALTSTNPLLAVAGVAARAVRRPGHRRPTCSTWPRASRAGAGSASPTTTSTGSAAGCPGAGVRWGLDAELAGAFAMERFPHNTWRLGPRPDPARRRDERRRPPPPRPRAAARRRRQQRDRPRRPAGRAGRPARRVPDRAGAAHARSRSGPTRLRDGVRGLTDVGGRRRLAAAAVRARAGPRRGVVARGRARAAARPTCARCSSRGWPAGRPAPTSAPARSPSARWCRCARCRTGWSAWSASTTASSRAPAPVDGDDVLGRRPLTGERDAAQRGPAAAPRRGAGRDRAPRHHLHRRQRAVRRARGPPPYPSARSSTPPTAPPPSRCATGC